MSVGGVISLGLGSWGSVAELVTLGYGSANDIEPTVIQGPCAVAGMVYLPGAVMAQAYLPGAMNGEAYLPGARAGGTAC